MSGIPAELQAWAQWVVWWRGDQRPDGRYAKVPYTPQTGTPARSNDPLTWGTFDQAHAAYMQQGYDGLGFMLSADDPFLVLDLDHCRDRTTGALTPEAEALRVRFDSYTEVSPSGTGIHVFIQATSPTGRNIVKPYEVYVSNHLITITGAGVLGTPPAIAERQDIFDAWFQTVRPPHASTAQDAADQMLPPTLDEAILRRVQRSAKAAKLWAGDRSGYRSPSEADAALIGCLARWTRDPDQLDRLFRRSGLYHRPELLHPRWDQYDYAQRTIAGALATVTVTQRPTTRVEQRILYTYDWQRRVEAPGEREAYLAAQAAVAKERVKAHIDALKEGHDDVAPLVISLAPGVGKTRIVATLGATYDLGWVAIRRDLHKELSASAPYRFIERCQPDNCPDAERMSRLASLRRTVMPLHRRHENGQGCGYYRQFAEKGSAFYRMEHLPSGYLRDHDAVIVDELEVLKWLKELKLTVDDLVQARRSPQWEYALCDPVRRLLKALQEVLEQARGTLHSKALFDALDAELDGHLAFRLEQATFVPEALDERPKIHEEADIPFAEQEGPVIVPYLVQWLREDLPKWQQGREWNSRAHIAIHSGRPTFHILMPLRPATGNKLAILDATANADVLSRLLGQSVQLERPEVVPPPNTRHIAVRIRRHDGGIKRYGKTSLADAKYAERSQDRVIREARHLLAQENPDGSRTVGLITHQHCQEVLGEALGIPAYRCGHFWGVRGSNDWEDCDILVVVGTPTPHPDSVLWAARALYADDPTPIATTGEGLRYDDPRLATLLEYLVNSELTQVAHRNRPIRHDGRVVITFTAGVVDHLPVTEEIVAFGVLPTQQQLARKVDAGQEQTQRLEEAYSALVAREEKLSVAALAREARVRNAVAGEYLRVRRRKEEEHFPGVQ